MTRALLPKFFLGMVFLFLVSCDETAIVHDLNERDSNEIIVLLSRNDIAATKVKEERNQEVFWSIVVAPDDEMRARSILVANNLPKVRQGGLQGICENTSMIVTEETEKCRKLLAYKGEIINSLESIPGVVSADVVLNLPDREEFPDENTPVARPTAAVTIKYLTDANVKTQLSEVKVQEFVANSITGMDSRDVAVIISYLEQKLDPINQETDGDQKQADAIAKTDDSMNSDSVVLAGDGGEVLVSVGGIMMDERSAQKFKIIAAVFLVLLLLLAFAFIFALFRMSKLRKQGSVPAELRETDQENADKKLLEA